MDKKSRRPSRLSDPHSSNQTCPVVQPATAPSGPVMKEMGIRVEKRELAKLDKIGMSIGTCIDVPDRLMLPVSSSKTRAQVSSQVGKHSEMVPIQPSGTPITYTAPALVDPKAPQSEIPWVNLFKDNCKGYLHGCRLKHVFEKEGLDGFVLILEGQVQLSSSEDLTLFMDDHFSLKWCLKGSIIDSLTPVWIRFEGLGPYLWSNEILGGMASKISVPIHNDMLTQTKEKLEYARCSLKELSSLELDIMMSFMKTCTPSILIVRVSSTQLVPVIFNPVLKTWKRKEASFLALWSTTRPLVEKGSEDKGSTLVCKDKPPATLETKARITQAKSSSSYEESKTSASITIISETTSGSTPSSHQGNKGVGGPDDSFKEDKSRKQWKTINDKFKLVARTNLAFTRQASHSS
ncbi:hypothetical protein V2J09_022582 [Rumex salicifolius]